MGSLYLRPKPNVHLQAWSLEQEIYDSNFPDGSYFLEFVQGLEDAKPWEFNVTVKVKKIFFFLKKFISKTNLF